MPEVQSRTYANPRRLPRRNHYQEGSGFLFVATQGGRPPEGTVQAGQAANVRRRRAALRRWSSGESIGVISLRAIEDESTSTSCSPDARSSHQARTSY